MLTFLHSQNNITSHIGVLFDSELMFDIHICHLADKCFYQL